MLTKDDLLAEAEDVLRTMPPRPTLRHATDENYAWFGRASAVIEQWQSARVSTVHGLLDAIFDERAREAGFALSKFITLLHQARHDLRMETRGPMSVVIDQGRVFDYFDYLRKLIQTARSEVLFVDAYLDADFVSDYLANVVPGTTIRLLAGQKKLATLLPGVDKFTQQTKMAMQVRSTANIHDRFLFVDRAECYQSGASFKDGPKNAPTTLTQITDAFQGVWVTYDQIWNSAKVER